jgi:hypothetical protein
MTNKGKEKVKAPIFIGKIRHRTIDTYINVAEVCHYDNHSHDPHYFQVDHYPIVQDRYKIDKLLVDFIKQQRDYPAVTTCTVRESRHERQLHRKYPDGQVVYQDFNICVCKHHLIVLKVGWDMLGGSFICRWVRPIGCLLEEGKLFPQTCYVMKDISIVKELSRPMLKDLAVRRNIRCSWLTSMSRKRLINLIIHNMLNNL